MATITAIIPHYFNQRAPSLIAACDALMRGSLTPDEILVWNNDQPLGFTMPDVQVIQAPRNIGSQARFVAALFAKGDLIFFQDNDVALERQALERLLVAYRDDPDDSLISLEGRRVTNTSYRKSQWLRGESKMQERADISLGRAEIINRKMLYKALALFPWSSDPLMDDLWFSWCCKKTGIPIWVLPAAAEGGIKQLAEYGVGSRFDEDHYRKRDELCRLFWGGRYTWEEGHQGEAQGA